MKQDLLSSRPLKLSGLLAVALCGLAATPAFGETFAPADTSACAAQEFSQAFASFKDNNYYTLVDGQSPGSFDGTGWTLSDGAQVVDASAGDASSRSVLDLPSGSKAVSPPVCVTSDYPRARAMVRNVVGGEGVNFAVSYAGTKTWDNPKSTGKMHGAHADWTAAAPVNIQPDGHPGWQVVRFVFVPGGKTSDFHLYDFYVDPRMKG